MKILGKVLMFFAFFLDYQLLIGQNHSKASINFPTLITDLSDQIDQISTDTSLVFEKIKPLLALAFEQRRLKHRKENAPSTQARFLFVVTTDGLRWQELFQGADSMLINSPKWVKDSTIRTKYWASSALERRKKLMPFLWSVVATEGQIHGNRTLGNKVNVHNRKWISYPGYSEMLCGIADDKIRSNAKKHNSNSNIFEWLNRQRGFRGKVAAFASWDVFPYILNRKKSNFLINAGFENRNGLFVSSKQRALNESQHLAPHPWGDSVRPDSITWDFAKNYVNERHPRTLFVALGETDEYAHEGQYDRYLDAAHAFDQDLAEFWNMIQSDPKYSNRSALLVTTDHGRGTGRQWANHNAFIAGSDEIWMAVLSPDIPALGEIEMENQIYQDQFAQTMSTLLGLEFRSQNSVAKYVKEIFKPLPVMDVNYKSLSTK